MSERKTATLLLACAFLWLSTQASLLFGTQGLLATYDLPTHLHFAAIQMRGSSALWDDSWYAGYPSYAYPPLAHRFAAALMTLVRVDLGFKLAVAGVYIMTVAVVYVAARIVAGLPPGIAALATLLVAISPALFRAFLFGQYPMIMAFLLFWAVIAAIFAALQADRADYRIASAGALLLAVLGSVHLYPILVLPLYLVPLLVLFPLGRVIRRIAPATILGVVLALLPSAMLLIDFDQFKKTPVPHITRTAEMVQPEGLLEWILSPPGLPMVLGLLILVTACGSRRGRWLGLLLSGLLLVYVRNTLSPYWLAVSASYCVLLTLAVGRSALGMPSDRLNLYLTVTGILSLWFSLGPSGGLARLAPLTNVLVFDRPLLLGVPFGYFAITRVLGLYAAVNNRHRGLVLAALGALGLALLGLSIQQVIAQYERIVPGAQGPLPQGTIIQADVKEFLSAEGGAGRILPLGLPPLAYVLPDVTGRPLIDGGYNDARQLTPLRRSGLQALGSEKFTYPDLPFVRFFLSNAEAYNIKWVVSGDRYYDAAIPLDRFTPVLESGNDPDRSIRIYRAIHEPAQAWEGPIQSNAVDVAAIAVDRFGPISVGGGMKRVDRFQEGSVLKLKMEGSDTYSWALSELDLSGSAHRCDQVAFRVWSPTGASLALRSLRAQSWLVIHSELPLPRKPDWHVIALNCQQVSRLQLAFTGSGFQEVFISPVILRQVNNLTARVSFVRTSAECFRVLVPHNEATVTVSLAYFPRWHVLDPKKALDIASNDLGLLTLRGPAGDHTVCLAFPPVFRLARVLLPVAYVGLSTLVLGALVLGRRRSQTLVL